MKTDFIYHTSSLWCGDSTHYELLFIVLYMYVYKYKMYLYYNSYI